jgi:Pentapeptide repeats (8 copies)
VERKVLAWFVLLVAAAVVVAAAVYAIFLPVSDLIARHDVGAITGRGYGAALARARDAARGRLLQLAGVFTVLVILFNARAFFLARQGLIADRYTKAVEQLGSKQLDVRIGGIYALELVARDSPRDHPTIMEVLGAFIREHSREQWPVPESADAPAPERATRPDVQAALTVIGRRDPIHDRQSINLGGADLTGARLTRADLGGADLTGARLTRADLRDADLTGADLTGARWPTAEPVPAGWMTDESGRLERAGRLSEVTAHYL